MRIESVIALRPARKEPERSPDPPANRPGGERLPLDVPHADAWLGGGLRADALHEFHAAVPGDGVAALGFALLLGWKKGEREGTRALLWLRMANGTARHPLPYGLGLTELGIDPAALRLLCLPDAKAVLRASLDAVRDGAAASVLIELHGRQTLLDLTATRRLALAAAETGTMALIVRSDAEPSPSAAQTRWRVASAPSRALEADAPGMPVFALSLLRQKGGRDGLNLIVEWDRDTASFRERAADASIGGAPLPRAVPAVDAGRAGGGAGARAA